jgi:serine/threonine-protein kinase
VRTACLGLTSAALQACMGAAQQVPPERPAPPPQACPAGAVETMTSTLGFRLGETKSVEWSNVRGRSVRVDEDSPVYLFGDWDAGADRFGYGGRFALPGDTRVTGRLYVKEGRVYGRFTEARTPLGVTYPVCLELLDTDDKVGLELEPDSAPGKMMVGPVAVVRVVDRFK